MELTVVLFGKLELCYVCIQINIYIVIIFPIREERGIIPAFMNGAMRGFELVKVIVVSMIIILAAVDFCSMTIEWFGDRAGLDGFNLTVTHHLRVDIFEKTLHFKFMP